MAAEHFFHPVIHQDYFDELDLNCKYFREIEWNIYYNKIIDIAFDLESRLGTQTAVSWAIRYLWYMPSRIRDGKNRLKLLLKIGFIWYNYTLELKYRYAVNEDEVMELYRKCKIVYVKLMQKCELADEDEDALVKLIDLVLAAISNRLEDINPNAEATLRKFVEDHGKTCNQETHLDIPEIIIALYFHEMALLEIKRGFGDKAIWYLNTSFLYLFEQRKYGRKTNLSYWQYIFGVVFDMVRIYSQSSSELYKEIVKNTYLLLKKDYSKGDQHSSLNIILGFAISSLATVLNLVAEDDEFKVYNIFVIDLEPSWIFSTLLQKPDKQSAIISPLLNVYLSYTTFLYPHYIKNKGIDVGNRLIVKVFDSKCKSLYGYKFIANTTFLFISVQYDCHENTLVSSLSKAISHKVFEDQATPELLCYKKFVKLFHSVVFTYLKRWEKDGKIQYAEATEINIEHRALSELASCICDCIQTTKKFENRFVKFINEHGENMMERILTAVAVVCYKNLSKEEILRKINTMCNYFESSKTGTNSRISAKQN